MTDISSISSSLRLTSQPKVSLESPGQQASPIQVSTESQKMEQIFQEMEQIQLALALTKDIRLTLESALRNLTPE
jgi:hypothetical protein